MGNRAVITFDEKASRTSPGIYLHWNGGPESVVAFLEAANHFHVRTGDPQYELARVVQIICNWFGGTTSVGVGCLGDMDCDNGDNGTYIAIRSPDGIKLKQSRDGETGWRDINIEEVKKHEYWHPKEGLPILEEVIEKNKAFFDENA